MPNAYAVVPNILPGNVTVGGNLTIAGDVLRLGSQSPYVRLYKSSQFIGNLSANLQPDGATRDDGANQAYAYSMNLTGAGPSMFRRNSAGTADAEAWLNALFTDYTAHGHTGTVTEDVIYSHLIPANILGTGCGIDVQVNLTVNAQGAGNTALRLKFGGGIIVATAFGAGAVAAWQWNVHMRNKGAANSQNSDWTLIGQGQPVQVFNGGATAVDTAVDQTLQIAVLNANAADSQTFTGCKFTLENTF